MNRIKRRTKRVSALLLTLVMVCSMMFVGTVNVSAADWNYNDGGQSYIYFDNTLTGWTDDYIQFWAGTSKGIDWTQVVTMKKITGTNLYYCKMLTKDEVQRETTFIAVTGNNKEISKGWFSDNHLSTDYVKHFTAANKTGYSTKEGRLFFLTPQSSSNGCTLNCEYIDGGYSKLMHSQEIRICTHNLSDSSYTYNNNGRGGGINRRIVYASGLDSTYYLPYAEGSYTYSDNYSITTTPVRRSESELIAVPKNGYKFDRWCQWVNDNKGTYNYISNSKSLNYLSSNTTYNYKTAISGSSSCAKSYLSTLYPCFSEIGYDITATAGTGGKVDGKASSTKKAGVYTLASFEAVADEGYTFSSWSNLSNVSSSSSSVTQNSTHSTNNVNAVYQTPSPVLESQRDEYNSGLSRSLKANFTETIYDITAEAQTGGSVALVSGKTAKAGISTTTQYTAKADSGYTFAGWELDGVTSTDSSSSTITINADPSKSTHKLTAKFTENKYSITASSQTGGTVAPVSVEAGVASTATFEANVTDTDHYEFDGWEYTGVNNVSIDGNRITVNADVSAETRSVTAKFKKTAYDVIFNSIGQGEAGNETIIKTIRYDSNKKIKAFYDIPERDGYVFKGWYYDDDSLVNFDEDTFNEGIKINAKWIEEGTAEKDNNDDNILHEGDKYDGFGLKGVQIRKEGNDGNFKDENGNTIVKPGGLRFITSLSQSLLDEIDSINDGEVNGDNVEYGYAVTKKEYALKYAEHFNKLVEGVIDPSYKLKNCGMVNGINTNPMSGFTAENDFRYVTNVNCTSEDYDKDAESNNRKYDHKKYKDYRLYSLVITYEEEEDDKAAEIIARPYLKYTDANGLERYHYSDYNGNSVVCGGCCSSYNTIMEMQSADEVGRQEKESD